MDIKNNKAVKTLSFSHFTIDVYSGFVNPLMPFFAEKLNFTLAIATLILSFSHLCSSLMQPIFGYISDKWKKRFFIFWGMALTSIFIPLIGIAPNVILLTFFLVMGSIGNGFFHPQATGLVNLFSEEDTKTKNIGMFLASGTIGYAIGPFISSLIYDLFSDKSLICTSLMGLIACTLIIHNIPKISHLNSEHKEIHLKSTLKDIFSNIPMRVLIMLSVAKSLTTQSFCILTPFLWRASGFSAMKIGLLLNLYLIFSALGTIASPKLEKKVGTKKVMILALAMVLPLSAGFYLTYKNFQIISFILFAMTGFFAMLSVPINMVLAHKVLPQYKNLTSGLIGGFSWGLVGISMSVVGLLAQKIGIAVMLVIISILPLVFTYYLKYLPIKDNEN